MPTVADRLIAEIHRLPGQSEAELAQALFGGAAYQQRVNSTCRRLLRENEIERKGRGGSRDPFRYHIAR